MPTPSEESLFKFLKYKKYEEALALVKLEKNLINAVNDKDMNSLLQTLLCVRAAELVLPLIQHIVVQPEFNFGYFNPEFETTNLDDLITSVRLDVFQNVIKNHNILMNGDKLSYQSAKEYLVLLEVTLAKDIQKNPNSPATAMSKQNVADLKEIIAYLRDATILYAIKTDDASLFDRLVKAGDDPMDNLTKLSKDYPVDLFTEGNRNLENWLEESQKKRRNNPNSIYSRAQEMKRLDAETVKVKQKFVTNIIEVHQTFFASTTKTVEDTIAAISSAAPPSGNGQSR